MSVGIGRLAYDGRNRLVRNLTLGKRIFDVNKFWAV